MRSKKAQVPSWLIFLLAMLAAFVVIGAFVGTAHAKAQKKGEELVCRNSVIFRSGISFNTGDDSLQYAPLMCKTLDREVEGDREEVKKEISRLMARCWWMFNDGKIPDTLDDVTDYPSKFLGFQGDNKCFICYSVLVNDDEFEGIIMEPELQRYMLNNNYPQVKDFTYSQYIQDYSGDGEAVLTAPVVAGTAYAITYVPQTVDHLEFTWLDGAALALTAAGIGICALTVVCGLTVAGVTVVGTTMAATSYLAYRGFESEETLMERHNLIEEEIYQAERDLGGVVLDYLDSAEMSGCERDLAGR